MRERSSATFKSDESILPTKSQHAHNQLARPSQPWNWPKMIYAMDATNNIHEPNNNFHWKEAKKNFVELCVWCDLEKMQLHFINPTINSINLVVLVDWHDESHNKFSLWIHQILVFSYEYQFSIFLFMKLYIYTHIYTQFPLALLFGNSNNNTMILQARC